MRLAVIPAAGQALRMGPRAPRGCKLFVRLPDGRLMVEYLHDLLAKQVDEIRFVVRDNVIDDKRLHDFDTIVDDSLAGPFHAIQDAGGLEADDLLVWYADTLADRVPEGTDWIGVGPAESKRWWDIPHDKRYVRALGDVGEVVCAGAYRFSQPAALRGARNMLDALNFYPGLTRVELPGWVDLDEPVLV